MPALLGKRIIITGGARGIGGELVRAFVEEGARVVSMDLREDAGRRLISELHDPKAARFVLCDISSSAGVTQAFAEADEFLGGLDVLAAVAGLDRPSAPGAVLEADWDLVFNVNAKGTYLTNQAAHALMVAHGGSIINFGSVAGIRGLADRGAYSAAKGAVAAWSRSAALAWGAEQVRVNVVAPMMQTEVASRFIEGLSTEEQAELKVRLAAQIPLGGVLGNVPTDLAPLMVFLAGDGSRYITGQTFAVDGGMTLLGS